LRIKEKKEKEIWKEKNPSGLYLPNSARTLAGRKTLG
jgi:hypothetical protein